MRITGCVPLAGQGVIARYGPLVAVTDGRGPGPDPLLSAIAETAGEHADGSALVIKAARAALGASRHAAWACAGATADGGLAVLVHGQAAVTVRIDDGPEFTLKVTDSMLPVSRTFTGSVITAILVIGGAEAPDERFWLGDGVMRGGGLAVTASAHRVAPRPQTPDTWQPPEARPRADASRGDISRGDISRGDISRGDISRGDASRGDASRGDASRGDASRGDASRADASRADAPRGDVPRGDGPRADMARADAARADVRPPATQEVYQTAVDVPVVGGAGGWSEQERPDQGGWHPPTLDTPGADPPLPAPPPEPAAQDAVFVDGVLCGNGHFNDPGARACRECRIGLDQPPRHFDRRPRPPLGELVIDDGTRFPLDGNYVLGREPALDGDVLAGRARPLRINDPNGTVSRLHLKISLVGWQVEISDLGSANGSVLQLPGEERTLTPFEPAAIEPGARIGIGHRTMQYVAYQGA